MPHVDFSLLIHELMVRDLSIASFMNELVVAHENAHPQYDWAPLKALDFDESESLLQRWLVPALEREPPRAKRIKAIWCGLFQPIRGEETVADTYIAGTKDFELDQVPRKWNVHPEYWPLLRYANSGVLANLYRCAYGESGPGNDAENYLGLGYAAKTISTLLGRVDAQLIFGSRKEVLRSSRHARPWSASSSARDRSSCRSTSRVTSTTRTPRARLATRSDGAGVELAASPRSS